MDIGQRSRAALQNSADALDSAAQQLKRNASWVADNAGDVAEDAWRGISRAGREVGSFARARPTETAVIMLIAGWVIGSLFARRRNHDD